MKKIITILALVIVVIIVCVIINNKGAKGNTYEIALITDVGDVVDNSFNQGAWKGIETYANANNITYNYYRPQKDTKDARIEKIKEAIDKGAEVVICPGRVFEEVIYEVQETYSDVQFLLIEGEPHDASYNYWTAENVHCILSQEEQAGYLAGYVAVMDGYRNLGFLGGVEFESVIRYGYGFIQGANDAAKELKVKDDVSIKYWYSGSQVATDKIKRKMEKWYDTGTEIIFTCGGGVYLSALSAAETADKRIIGSDVNQAMESELIITSAVKNINNVVKLALTDLYSESKKKWPEEIAGQTVRFGVANDCIGLATDKESWRFEEYTVEEYKKLYENIKEGIITISDNIMQKPTVEITVDYQ